MDRRNIAILLTVGIMLIAGYCMMKKGYSWQEKYHHQTNDPFDTKVIFRMLHQYFEGTNFTELEYKIAFDLPTLAEKSNYIFIGNNMYADSSDIQTLLRYVALGNTAFISANHIPYQFNQVVGCNIIKDDISLDKIILNFYHDDLHSAEDWECHARGKYVLTFKKWTHFFENPACNEDDSGLLKLGYLNNPDLYNFIRINHGEGSFYFHTTPLMFSNLHLLKAGNERYAENVFSHLESGDIYWDSASKKPRTKNPFDQAGDGTGGAKPPAPTNPLQYVLVQEAMAWAWYLLLSMGLLYLFFYTNRKQRIIPVTEKNENLSLEFITTLGKLHYVNNNHLQLAKEKIKLFKLFIRERYHLSFKVADEDFFATLAMRSEIDIETLRKTFFFARNVESAHSLTDKTLMELHRAFEDFYRNCK